jgi:hypothetical protein
VSTVASNIGQLERKAQDRVVGLFRESLGYSYLGNWETRLGNSNIEVELLVRNLRARGYDDKLINKAVDKLKKDASLGGGRDLYEANRDVYGLLRYGVKVKRGAGEQFETVWLIDWSNRKANDFAVAEEVTVLGQHTKWPAAGLPPSLGRPGPGRGRGDRPRGAGPGARRARRGDQPAGAAAGHRPVDEDPGQPAGRRPGPDQPQRQAELPARPGRDGDRVGRAERRRPARPIGRSLHQRRAALPTTHPRTTGT